MFNKKGQSAGYAWIYGLVSLFGLGIMYIVFSQVFTANLVPTIIGLANQSYTSGGIDLATYHEIEGGINRYMSYFNVLPFILFFSIVIFMFVASIRKESDSRYV